ncbi:MAG: twin transmembrane helix small protein [Xanthomonadaceae bacterium]|nr:twin transmembrane helix small protein [Xanthomonadaceae bacterium]
MSPWIKLFIIVMLLAILTSLGAALVFLLRDSSRSKRTAWALTVRITLSVVLFLTLLIGMATGVIIPHPAF